MSQQIFKISSSQQQPRWWQWHLSVCPEQWTETKEHSEHWNHSHPWGCQQHQECINLVSVSSALKLTSPRLIPGGSERHHPGTHIHKPQSYSTDGWFKTGRFNTLKLHLHWQPNQAQIQSNTGYRTSLLKGKSFYVWLYSESSRSTSSTCHAATCCELVDLIWV